MSGIINIPPKKGPMKNCNNVRLVIHIICYIFDKLKFEAEIFNSKTVYLHFSNADMELELVEDQAPAKL